MKKIIRSFAIEVTRRCNQSCKHCMRGETQNIDIDKYYIDLLFEKDLIILQLIFSGGEPTLCEDLIEYTINKIISQHKSVLSIYIATNGLIYSDRILKAFSNYVKYAEKSLSKIYELIPVPKQMLAVVEISNDEFHKEIDMDSYKKKSSAYNNITLLYRNFIFFILLTGRAKEGINYPSLNYEYKLYDIDIELIEDTVIFSNAFYLTATGIITNNGDGSYIDMDKINLGKIEEFSFDNLYKQEINKKKIKK